MTFVRRFFVLSLLIVFLSLSYFFKFGFPFPLVVILFPLLGGFLDVGGLIFIKSILLLLFFVKTGAIPLTFGLPTLLAGFCFRYALKVDAKQNLFDFCLRFCLPLLSILLFVFHPVSKMAYPYSFYWFIPMGLYFFDRVFPSENRRIFSASFSAVFVAHAVGSIIWLFLVPMTYLQWLSLIPVVLIERFIMSISMFLAYNFVLGLISYLDLYEKRAIIARELKLMQLNLGGNKIYH